MQSLKRRGVVLLPDPVYCTFVDSLWQTAGIVPLALIGALQSRMHVLAAGGLVPSALAAAMQWAWQTESPPQRGSFLAALHAYAVELLQTFR